MTTILVRGVKLAVGPGDETGGTANLTTAARFSYELPASSFQLLATSKATNAANSWKLEAGS
jgi:hypothetical protein